VKEMADTNTEEGIGPSRHAKGTGTQKAIGTIQIADISGTEVDGMKVKGMAVTNMRVTGTKVENIINSTEITQAIKKESDHLVTLFFFASFFYSFSISYPFPYSFS
jgi:hypothetical protein